MSLYTARKILPEVIMRARTLTHIFVGLVVLFGSCACSLFAADNFAGTWKMNLTKSSSPGITSNISEISSVGAGIKLVGNSVNSTGERNHLEFTAQFDNKDYPIIQTIDGKSVTDSDDRVSARKVDDYTLEITRKSKGSVQVVIRMVVSKDGKTMTNTVTGIDQGQTFSSTTIFDRQ
jgi:hypothetical protein